MLPLILLVVTGTVTTTTSRWQGDVIVTEAEVRAGSGETVKVVQLGGSVGGLGMSFSHQPVLVEVGDAVTIDGARVIGVASRASLLPAGGNATYGVQRTAKSGIPLWRSGGCMELVYDARTITPANAQVIDAAFEAWSIAAASCGQLGFTSTRRDNPPALRDDFSTVRIRRERWCNPGNALEPEVCYAKEASAVTRLLFIDDPTDDNDGKILDADIELNGVDYVLVAPNETAPATTKPVIDLQAVVTHEAGHALGLAHNCGTGDEAWPSDHAGNAVPACTSTSLSVRSATMYYAVTPGDVGPRTVEVTDVAGVCELARELTCGTYVEGGCRSDRGGSRWWFVLVALMLVRRRSRSSYDRRHAMTGPMPQRIQRFEVREHLGSGGMGSVYRAYDPQLDREVAIKVLADPSRRVTVSLSPDDTLDLRTNPSTSSDELLREARMMAQLSHPNVLPVYEVGLVDGALFVVMEHIAGRDLATWLDTPRTTAQILALFAQAAHGLAEAHARGIVHRDFKPANVLVGSDGRVRVADFGLSAMATPTRMAMVRVDDGSGTPRYMAPELWGGAPATTKSDIYAFSVALGEALDGRSDVPPAVRELVAAGGGGNPDARPEVARFLAALEQQPPQGAQIWLLVAAATVVAVLAGSVLAYAQRAAADCDRVPVALEPARRARLVAFAATHRDIVGLVDAAAQRDAALGREAVKTCVAEHEHRLTPEQANVRRSCLQRRTFELTATINRIFETPVDAVIRLGRVGLPENCIELETPPLPVDTTAAAALWSRYVRAYELTKIKQYDVFAKELRAIEQEAMRTNERELALEIQHNLATLYIFLDKLDDADALLQTVYRNALELKGSVYAAAALLDRASIAKRRHDRGSAENFVELARALADKPTSSPTLRAHIYRGLGFAAVDRAEYEKAADLFAIALDLVQSSKSTAVYLELELMNQLALAHARIDGHSAEAIEAAKRSVNRARELVGERDHNYAHALNGLTVALRASGDAAAALDTRRQALDVFATTLPASSSQVIVQRLEYANDLMLANRFVEAREHYVAVLAATEHNESVKQHKASTQSWLAAALFYSGAYEQGLDMLRESIEGLMAQHGTEHARVAFAVGSALMFELELDRLDEAKRSAASMERILDKHSGGEWTVRKALYTGMMASVLQTRLGHPKRGEQLAREALAILAETKAPISNEASVRGALAESLLAQRRFAAARQQVTTALALTKQANSGPDSIAVYEVLLARIDEAEGNHAGAVERARKARAVLDKHPRHIRARADADRLLRPR